MARKVSFLSLFAVVLVVGCSSAPPTQQVQPPQRTWRDSAQECYERAARGGTPTWRGRTGREACDLFVEDMRYEEAARLNAIMPYLLQQQQQQTPPPPQWLPPPSPSAPPPLPLNCYTYYVGNVARTQCH